MVDESHRQLADIFSISERPEWRLIDHDPMVVRVRDEDVELSFASFTTEPYASGGGHKHLEVEGSLYDIPMFGSLHTVIFGSTDGSSYPIGVLSAVEREGIATITMIQRCQNIELVNDEDSPPQSDKVIVQGTRKEVDHALKDLLRGEGKLKWPEILMDEVEQIFIASGYPYIQIVSGLPVGDHFSEVSISFRVQQYDCLVYDLPEWIPMSRQRGPITGKAREAVVRNIRRLRDGRDKVFSYANPHVQTPYYWRKKLIATA